MGFSMPSHVHPAPVCRKKLTAGRPDAFIELPLVRMRCKKSSISGTASRFFTTSRMGSACFSKEAVCRRSCSGRCPPVIERPQAPPLLSSAPSHDALDSAASMLASIGPPPSVPEPVLSSLPSPERLRLRRRRLARFQGRASESAPASASKAWRFRFSRFPSLALSACSALPKEHNHCKEWAACKCVHEADYARMCQRELWVC